MKNRMLVLLTAMAILLSGCQLVVRDDYHWESQHLSQTEEPTADAEPVYFETVQDYDHMKAAVLEAVTRSVKKAVLTVDVRDYAGDFMEDYRIVREEVENGLPDSAYLLESISAYTAGISPRYELNLLLCYRRTNAELGEAISVASSAEAISAIETALDSFADHLLLRFTNSSTVTREYYQALALNHTARTYYENHLTTVMSQPFLIWDVYPKSGKEQLLEIEFYYPRLNNGLDLKTMQSSVKAIMDSSETYVQDYDTDLEKAMLLHSFLAARLVEVREEMSAAPAYDLLICGVADSRAFSAVYRQMCNQAGVSCKQVHGRKDGVDYYWNILELSSGTWHVDPLWDAQKGQRMQLLTDGQMYSYAWETAHYPVCFGAIEPQQTQTAAGSEPDEPPETAPEDTPPKDVPPEEPPAEPDPSSDLADLRLGLVWKTAI